jgi:hypothetical protein
MHIEFATCDRRRALEFIRKVYPSREVTDTPESAGPLLDLVEKDVMRIQDPMMYGMNIQAVPGKNWVESPELRAEMAAVAREFHERMTR